MVRASDHFDTTLHLGAFVDGELVGVVTAEKSQYKPTDPAETFRMHSFAVLRGVRGYGVGPTLACHMLSALYDSDAERLWLTPHPSTMTYYRALGLQPTGEKFQYGDEGSLTLDVFAVDREGLRQVIDRLLPKSGRWRVKAIARRTDPTPAS
jgi:predicted N-acetyltransferase YhbS